MADQRLSATPGATQSGEASVSTTAEASRPPELRTTDQRAYGPPFTVERYGSLGACIVAERDYFRYALMDIAKGNGPYKMDQYEFACSVIENMKRIAEKALAGTYEPE